MLLCYSGFAQNFPYKHYTTADGLINSSVYVCYQDHRGFMWFGTENGVSRFDGNTFKNYTVADGLPGNMVMSITENENGQLYFGTKSQGIATILNDSITKVYNDSLGIQYNFFLEVNKSKAYSLNSGSGLIITNLKNYRVEKLYKEYDEPNSKYFKCLKKLKDGTIVFSTNKGCYKLVNDTFSEINLNNIKGKTIYSIFQNEDTVWLGATNVIYKMVNWQVKDSIIVRTNGKDIIENLLVDHENGFWILSKPSNIVYHKIKDQLIDCNKIIGLNKTNIGQIQLDEEGGVWISTVNDGVYCINDFYLKMNFSDFVFRNNYITALSTLNHDNLLVGTSDGLYNINLSLNNLTLLLPSIPTSNSYYIKNIDARDTSDIVIGQTGETGQTVAAGPKNIIKRNINGLNFSICHTNYIFKESDSIFLSGNWSGGFRVYNINTGVWHPDIWMYGYNIHTGIRTNSIYKTKDGTIWIGTSKGLLTLDKSYKIHRINYGFLKSPINSIATSNNNDIWLCTDQGIAIYDGHKWQYITEMNGVRISSVTSVAFDDNNRAWIGTMNGLYMMGHNTLRQLDLSNGLPSNQINALLYDKIRNQLFIGTAKGLVTLDISMYNKTVYNAPSVIITDVSSMQKKYALFEHLNLTSAERTLTINFTAISLSLAHQLQFQYSLDGNKWTNASNVGRSIQFVDMDYGTHRLELRCGFGNDEWSKPTALNFNIYTPYWAALWFRILMFLIAIGIITSIAWWRVNAIRGNARERLEFNDRINELRHQALAASMNPHFVFNSLNSIQHFINAREPHEASDYLGRFSRLIRQTVNLSTESTITLDEEIERLRGYLDLEQLRLGDSLSYEIIMDSAISLKNIQIPNMVIQPFVENAIWHGIMPAKRNGKVTIGIYDDDTQIRIEITDNGVGFKQSTKKTNHISKGMQIVRERLKPINGSNPIIVEDLSDIGMKISGTRVTLKLVKTIKP